MAITDFMGSDGFIWFAGVVEDREDPLKLGRVRVRAVGYHTENKEDLPTEDLPWAHPLLPITSSGVSGLGQTPLGLVEGSWVIGFFRDAKFKQDAVVMGSLPGKPFYTGAEDKQRGLGFSDPNGAYPRNKDESDVNRLARTNTTIYDENGDSEVIKKEEDKEHLRLTLRKSERSAYLNIPTTTIMSVPTPTEGSGDFGFKWTDASEGDVWSLPENTHNTLYPHGHVYETESGHIMEFDDTKEAARILLYHRSGSEMEITDKGTKNTLNKDSTYTITEKDKKVYIKGNSDLTIRGRHKIIINADGEADNNYDIQVGPNANVNIQCDKGDINLTSLDGNLNMFSNNDLNMWVGGTWNVKAGQIIETSQTTTTRKAAGLYHTFGGPIDHN